MIRREWLIRIGGAFGLFVVLCALPATSASASQKDAGRSDVRPFSVGTLRATFDDPGATSGDEFGTTVAESAATTTSHPTSIVGAPLANSSVGAAYIYVKGSPAWPNAPTVTLTDPPATPGDTFGSAVALFGNTAVVTAYGTDSSEGAAYIYVKGSSGWPTTPTATLADPGGASGDLFGYSVAASGNSVIVGAPFADTDGAAFVYNKGTAGWPTAPTATLQDPSGTSGEFFGASVSISGKTAVVGAYGTNSLEGAAYVYTELGAIWSQTPAATLGDPTATSDDVFGFTVAVSGNTAIIGAFESNAFDGAAYIYTKGSLGWPTTPTVSLADPNATSNDSFGNSVAVMGTTVVIGADGANSGIGAAYVYDKDSSGWPIAPSATLTDPVGGAFDSFGLSVATSGATAAVGAPDTSSLAGAAYIFRSAHIG